MHPNNKYYQYIIKNNKKIKMVYNLSINKEIDRLKADIDKYSASGDTVELKKIIETRTNLQNRALHLYFNKLSIEHNKLGLTCSISILNNTSIVEVKYSPDVVKDYIWRPIMMAYCEKTSTTELTTQEIDAIYDIINKFLCERGFEHIPFPSMQTLLNQKDQEAYLR